MDDFRHYLSEQGISKRSITVYIGYVRQALKRKSMTVILGEGTCSTRKSSRAAIKQWAKFKNDVELLEELDSIKVIKMIKRSDKPSRVSRPLSASESSSLINVINSLEGRKPQWVWPCLSLLVKLGLRVRVDLIEMTRNRVVAALETDVLEIQTKGGKSRRLPAHFVAKELQTLLDVDKSWKTVADIVAPKTSLEDRPAAAYRKVYRALRAVSEGAGIDPSTVYPHRLRHTAADRLWQKTGDLLKVKEFLGHNQVTTTERYLQGERLDEIGKDLEDIYD